MNKKLLTILGLIGVGIAGRLLPHAPNATPITAITLAAQKHVGQRWAFFVPLAAMFVADACIGFYNWKIMVSVYGSFILIGYISRYIQKSSNILAIMLLTTTSSVLFFLVTNFAVWAFSPWYEKSIYGLLYSYELGIPFFRAMLAGDIVYSALILGAFELAQTGIRMKPLIVKTA